MLFFYACRESGWVLHDIIFLKIPTNQKTHAGVNEALGRPRVLYNSSGLAATEINDFDSN